MAVTHSSHSAKWLTDIEIQAHIGIVLVVGKLHKNDKQLKVQGKSLLETDHHNAIRVGAK